MKLPDLSKLKPARKPAAAAKRPRAKVPQPMEDIYRDLRDRRLLLPLVLLIVAIAAVPVALSATKEDPPAPLASVPPEGAEAVSPAVLTEQPVGVRDYRERLEELKSKDPFASDFDPAAAASPADITTPEGEPVAPDAPAGSTAPLPGDSTTTDPGTPTGTPSEDETADPQPSKQILVLAPRLDVVAGRAGNTRAIKNVKMSDLLPTKKVAPIAMFIGASENLKSAHFAISDNVTKSKGEGSCSPSGSDCEFLKLAVGKKRVFTYGPHAKRYSIKVTGIRQVVVDRRKAP